MANEIDSNTLVITKKAIELVSTEMKYHLSTEKVAPAIDNTWLDSPPVMEGEYKYLWAYYIYTYSNETVVTSEPVLIGTTATSPLVCYVEPDSFILPSDEYGYVSDYKNNVQSVISLLQSESGETKLLTYDSALSANGTYNITFTASGISFCELDGSLFKATDGTTMASDTATVVLTINYLDYYGEKGTIQKTISVVKNKQGQTGAYTIKQWCISDSATTPGDSPEWLDDMPVLANSNKYIWYRSKDIPKGTDPDTVEWGTPELETTLRLNMADSSLLIGQHEVALSGKRILLDGSVSADQLEAELLIAQDLQITDGLDKDGNVIAGKIRSYGYEKGNVEDSTKTSSGFYMDNNGNLEAINASFKNAQTYNLTMVGGEILGENNPLNTLVSSSGEASFKNCSSNPIYVKGSDLLSLISNNCPKVDNVTQAMIDAGGGGVLWLGNTKYPYVAFVSGSEVALSEETISWTTSTASVSKYYVITCAHTFTFTAPCPGTYYFDYTPPAILANYGSKYVLNNVQYKLDDGDLVYHRKSLGDSTSLPSPLSVYVSAAGSHTLYVEHESSEYALISYRSLDYSAKISYNQSGGLYAFISVNKSLFLSTVTFTDSYHDAYYSYGSVTSSSLTKYSSFTGIQRSTGGSYSYYSVTGAISAKNLVLNGISKGEASIVYNLDSIYIYKDGVMILSFGANDYLSSANYPSFSFSALDSSKGVYVDDLFVKVDSSGNYKGSGDIGSGSRPFHYAYIDSLLGKTANLSGSLQVSSVDTDSISASSISAGSLSVGTNGYVQLKEGSTYGRIELYNKFSSDELYQWYIEASNGNLFIGKDNKFIAYLTSSGLYGGRFIFSNILNSVTSTGTYNLTNSAANYTLISITCQFYNDGAYGKVCVSFKGEKWVDYNSDHNRLIVSSDSKYVAFYFASETQIVINSKNDNFTLSMIGLY